MVTILVLGAFVAMFFRRYYFYRASEDTRWDMLFMSSKYFLPQTIHDEDDHNIKSKKKAGNVALVIFYFLFLDAIFYAFLVPSSI